MWSYKSTLPPLSHSYKGNGTRLVTRRSRHFPNPKSWYLPTYLPTYYLRDCKPSHLRRQQHLQSTSWELQLSLNICSSTASHASACL